MSEFTPPGGEPPHPERPPDPWSNPYQPYGAPSPYGDTAAAFARARTSRKMAGWALGLSLVLCLHPITLLVSAGLAIAVLVRSGDGRDHGRGMAIAALIINAIWVLVVIILVVTGVIREFTKDAERDDDGRVTERSDISAFKLRVGDCLNDPSFAELEDPDDTGVAFEVEAVPCSDPHDFEVFHQFELPDGDYPGEEEVFRVADKECADRVVTFTGRLGRNSSLVIAYYVPQSREWQLLDDREVTCIIGDHKRKIMGTLRGVGR